MSNPNLPVSCRYCIHRFADMISQSILCFQSISPFPLFPPSPLPKIPRLIQNSRPKFLHVCKLNHASSLTAQLMVKSRFCVASHSSIFSFRSFTTRSLSLATGNFFKLFSELSCTFLPNVYVTPKFI